MPWNSDRQGSLGLRRFSHLAASLINKKTGNLKMAKKQLGHSTMDTTANVYTHPRRGRIGQAATVLQDLVNFLL